METIVVSDDIHNAELLDSSYFVAAHGHGRSSSIRICFGSCGSRGSCKIHVS